MSIGGGRNLGTAVGRINIDTSSAEQAAVTVKRVGRDTTRSFDDATKAVDAHNAALKRYNGALSSAAKSRSGVGVLGNTSGLKSSIADMNTFTQKIREGQAEATHAASVVGRIGAATQTAKGHMVTFGQGVQQVRAELTAVGVAAGILTKIGLDGAKSIRNYRVSFKNLLGDEQQAIDLMSKLTDQANDFGIEVEEVWQLARALLPSLKGNTEELDEFVKRAALLASTNPLKSTVDASRAIQEYLSGQTISLQRLFNVDPNLIEDAQNQFEGVGEQLDFILTTMGATEEGALAMADSFTSVKNELKLALAEGFTPLFNTLQPILTKIREFISGLRESNPAILSIGAGFIAVTAVAAPLVLILGQIITSLQTIAALGIVSKLAALGPAAVAVGAIAAGAAGGNAIGRGIGRATGNEEIANTTLQDMPRILRQAAVVVADGAGKLVVIMGGLVSKAAVTFVNGVASMINSMGRFVQFIGQILPKALGGDRIEEVGENLQDFSQDLKDNAETLRRDFVQRLVDGQEALTRATVRAVGLDDQSTQSGSGSSGGTGRSGASDDGGISDQLQSAINNWYSEIEAIEERFQENRTQAVEQYESQRASAIKNFNKTSAREEEDFLRSRARQNKNLQRDILNIGKERVKREAALLEDLNERIADLRSGTAERLASIREEGNKRLEEAEEDYNRRREQSAAEHANRLLDAASRLDARGVAEEQRRYALQTSTAEDEFKRRIDKEKESLQERLDNEKKNLQERIEQENEAHQERLEEARKADAERIAEMKAALAEQQRLEDEDRKIRLARAKQDHDEQLAELKRTHDERLQDIKEQAAKERQALDRKFEQELVALNIASDEYLKVQADKEREALENFEKYWSDWNKIIEDQQGTADNGALPQFAAGGSAPFTGPAMLHGTPQRPETVLSQDTTASLKSMLGNFDQASLLNAVAGGNRGGASVTIADGAIRVFGAAGQSPEDVAKAVRLEMTSLLRSMA